MRVLCVVAVLLSMGFAVRIPLAAATLTLQYGTVSAGGTRLSDEYAITRVGMTVGQSVAGTAFGPITNCVDNVGFWHWRVLPVLDVRDESAATTSAFHLYPCVPNPFELETTITYTIPAAIAPTQVRLAVYDIGGRLVQRLEEEQQKAGTYAATWDGRDGRGQAVGAGVYFCCVRAGPFQATRRLVVLRGGGANR